MASKLDAAVKRIIASLFAPANLVRSSALSGPTLLGIVLLLVGTLIVAAPPFREAISEAIFKAQCLEPATKETGKEYSDFAMIVFQILIALTIGGVLVTDRIAAFMQSAALALQHARERSLDAQQARIEEELYAIYQRTANAGRGITVWNFPKRMMSLFGDMQNLTFLTAHRLPLFFMFLLLFRFGAAFPKGLYGVVALILLEGLLVAQVAKTYFEYLPLCGA